MRDENFMAATMLAIVGLLVERLNQKILPEIVNLL